ncbi:MAG: serine/threonine-protein phosphatase [Muribaculaceae bacterium]|nr:serine/threonine-protein phosphatase [Muribaculaceae bacterium]
MKFDIFSPVALSEKGQRDNQEDNIFPALGSITSDDRLFLVCDGMGGHEKGEVASAAVSNAVSKWINDNTSSDGVLDDEIVVEAIKYARKQLDELDDGSVRKMGTTLTMVCLHNGGVTMGHIGDSRIYHIRPSQRRILYKTIDHSLVYDLFMAGDIAYEDMATSNRRNVITRALMPGEDNDVNIDLAHTTDVLPGDYFYLCSDGMLEQMSDSELVSLLASEVSDESKIEQLRAATMGNKDNHSAILIKIKGVSNEVGDDQLVNDEKTSNYNEVSLLARMAAKAAEPAPVSPLDMQAPAAPVPQMPPAPPAPAPAADQVAQAEEDDEIKVVSEEPGRRARVQDVDDFEDYKPKAADGNLWLKALIGLLAAAVVFGAAYLIWNKFHGDKSTDQSGDAKELMENIENKNTGNSGGENTSQGSKNVTRSTQNSQGQATSNSASKGTNNGGQKKDNKFVKGIGDAQKAQGDDAHKAYEGINKPKTEKQKQEEKTKNAILNRKNGGK